MDTIKDILQTFKKPLIIIGILLIVFIIFGKLMPAMKHADDSRSPIVEIKAENDRIYAVTEEISVVDFSITAIHENGSETPVNPELLELSKTTPDKAGPTTTVTLTSKEDPSIYCNADVNIQRDKVMGFECGYPNVSNVIAVLYSNGELCFEGEGDTLVTDGGEYPWKEQAENITSVTFEKGVQPRVMDYWFSGMESLSYVSPVPSSVVSMKETFSGCIGMSTMADWTKCDRLLNTDGCYSGCTMLKYTIPFPSSVVRSNKAFDGCIQLQKTPNLSSAESLMMCSSMFSGCTKLVSVTVPPNAVDMSSMFFGCTNLQVMPSIPESVTNMSSAFEGCTAMKTLSTIPAGVVQFSKCFCKCEFLQGSVTINANPESLDGCFSEACVATRLDLNGSSIILDAFANTNENGTITVNGMEPNPKITSLDAYEDYLMEVEKEREEAMKQEENQQ